ncbi:MAG: metallophosphoesterase [Candidatus Eisenbacteria bacterium]|nr:metallophosphoesterase [Candidatus Eisenbacteria bacterium]
MPIIIHTSDVHLGAPLGWLGPRAAEQREELRRTLSKIVDLVIDQHADALVVAGNLFHSNNPSAATVRFVLRELARLTSESRASVVLLPGSHDSLGIESVYTSYRAEFGRLDRISVLGLDGGDSVAVEHAGLKIHGTPAGSAQPDDQQDVLDPDTAFAFNVAVLQDSAERSDGRDGEPMAADGLPGTGWSYFALGHLRSWHEIEGVGVPAIYPGSPELVVMEGEGQGHVARVELRASGTIVSKVRVGARSVVEARVEVTDASDSFSIAERVRQQAPANPNAVLKLALTGLTSAEAGIDDWDLVEELARDYFFVCPPVRDYHVKVTDQDLVQLPERLVVGRFARHLRSKLEEAGSEEERQEIEDALQLGVALLQGKDV